MLLAGIVRSQQLLRRSRRSPGPRPAGRCGRPAATPVDNSDSAQFAIGECKTIAQLQRPGQDHAHLVDAQSRWTFAIRARWCCASTGTAPRFPRSKCRWATSSPSATACRPTVNSLPVKVSSYGRGYNCYWQMPFREEARITLTNESDKEPASCYYQIDWVRLDEPPEPTMYFHARYHQEYPPEMGKPYTVFVGQGRGHYVGTVLSSQNGIGHWFGEGDDMFYIDGEEQPSLQGTGTEDYINEAWNMRVHSSLYTGCTVFEPRAPGRAGDRLPLAHPRSDHLPEVAEVRDRTPRLRDELAGRGRFARPGRAPTSGRPSPSGTRTRSPSRGASFRPTRTA